MSIDRRGLCSCAVLNKREVSNKLERLITTALVTAGESVCVLHTNVFSEERGQSVESEYVHGFTLFARNKEGVSYATKLLCAPLHGINFFLLGWFWEMSRVYFLPRMQGSSSQLSGLHHSLF